MVSSSTTAVQDQNLSSHSNKLLSTNNEVLHNEHFPSRIDFSLKVRKPYTISKQRERWTEEEHKKFLEALKFYGRAWRRIEEHVGTKTAVQIRSHAQKFFSKVVRDSSGSDSNTAEPIEIPPPRPKRKPLHPYPRKMFHPLAKETRILERPVTSQQPSLSISGRENQSPTSVLSTVGSDALGSTDSSTLNCSSSPIQGQVEDTTTPTSAPDEKLFKVQKFNLFPDENDSSKEDAIDERSPRTLRLFGKTVLVSGCRKPSPPINGMSTLPSSDIVASETKYGDTECTWSRLQHGQTGTLCYVQFKESKNSDTVGAGSSSPLQWCTLYGGAPFSLLPMHEPIFVRETQKESSRSGSNSESLTNEGSANIDMESETRSQPTAQKETRSSSSLDTEDKSGLKLDSSKLRVSAERCLRGFVPYRRSVAEKDCQSSTTGLIR